MTKTPGVKVVGIKGLKGVGKSSVAQHLVEGWGYKRAAFAGPMKDEAALALALLEKQTKNLSQDETESFYQRVRAEMDDPELKKRYRLFMQWIGTEWRRVERPSYWVDKFAANLPDLAIVARGPYKDTDVIFPEPLPALLVVDDLRFLNEAALCDTIIHVGPTEPSEDTHASERELFLIPHDGRIVNPLRYRVEGREVGKGMLHADVDNLLESWGWERNG